MFQKHIRLLFMRLVVDGLQTGLLSCSEPWVTQMLEFLMVSLPNGLKKENLLKVIQNRQKRLISHMLTVVKMFLVMNKSQRLWKIKVSRSLTTEDNKVSLMAISQAQSTFQHHHSMERTVLSKTKMNSKQCLKVLVLTLQNQ